MESLKELYRIGPGPSSSHSLGVRKACEYYKKNNNDHDHYIVELYGSLSLTGKGHMSDKVIYDYFGKDHVDVLFMKDPVEKPNTMKFYTFDNGIKDNEMTIYSVGGGAIDVEGVPQIVDKYVYPEKDLSEILAFCQKHEYSLADYVYHYEPQIKSHLYEVLDQIVKVVEEGLTKEGYLPGELHLERMAHKLYKQALEVEDVTVREKLLLSASSYAAVEESACGGTVVTSPTLGASGIVSALMYYYYHKGYTREQLINALAAGGVIGNVVKTNATISGASGGCQAEIGTACAMGAAMAAYLEGLSNHQIEYAAEVAMEHNLGLTCDPVGGYVQIPCIERNGVGVLRSIDAMIYAKYLGKMRKNRVSFDMVVKVMAHTGKQLPVELRETSLGGLAIEVQLDKKYNEI